MKQYFGKYRGTVTDNKDPWKRGRIQVSVPSIYGKENLHWAYPCTPYAGKSVGFFTIPPLNANVWVEFEDGNPNYPIWAGCFWAEGEVPEETKSGNPDMKVWRTDKAVISIDDDQGVVTIQVFNDTTQTIILENRKITIDNGNQSVIVLDGTLKVTINKDGLEVN
jgi:uncharacterized protein involved in type VI secretion and phage assembly